MAISMYSHYNSTRQKTANAARASAAFMTSMPASVLRDIRKALECANAHGELKLLDKALAEAAPEAPNSIGNKQERSQVDGQLGVTSSTDINIDAKAGTLPLTAFIDAGNQLLRMSKDGQRVIIKHRSVALTLNITLTRVAMGNFTESYSAESHSTEQMI